MIEHNPTKIFENPEKEGGYRRGKFGWRSLL
jgi:hypothetical protein